MPELLTYLLTYFREVFSKKVCVPLNKTAIENRTEFVRKKQHVLPESKNIQLFINYLNSRLLLLESHLVGKFDLAAWVQLSKLTLVLIVVYNRKRPGDVERSLVSEFEAREFAGEEDLIQMTNFDQQIAANYKRYITRGKLNNPSFILINKKMESCLNMMIKYRSDARIINENEYLFAKCSETVEHLSAYFAMREFLHKEGLENSNITTTNLRKHLASITSSHSEAEVRHISDFMGQSTT